MPCRRQSSASFAPASYSLTIPMICSSVNRLGRICPPPERRSNRFSLSVAPFQGAGSPRLADLEQPVQQALLGATLQQPRAELAQHRIVEAGVGQLQPEQVLPVDAGAHRLRGLPVGQVLPELQQGDQRQAPGRQARLAERGEQVGEGGGGEDGPQLVPQFEERVALAEGGPRDARRSFGYGADRAGFERHGGPPAGWTRRSIPVHLSSADFANGI